MYAHNAFLMYAHNAFLSTSFVCFVCWFYIFAKSKFCIPFIHLCVGDLSNFPVSTLSCRYGMAVSWLTALVMTVVHDRVPDMAK